MPDVHVSSMPLEKVPDRKTYFISAFTGLLEHVAQDCARREHPVPVPVPVQLY